jgi:hypothetical protein
MPNDEFSLPPQEKNRNLASILKKIIKPDDSFEKEVSIIILTIKLNDLEDKRDNQVSFRRTGNQVS